MGGHQDSAFPTSRRGCGCFGPPATLGGALSRPAHPRPCHPSKRGGFRVRHPGCLSPQISLLTQPPCTQEPKHFLVLLGRMIKAIGNFFPRFQGCLSFQGKCVHSNSEYLVFDVFLCVTGKGGGKVRGPQKKQAVPLSLCFQACKLGLNHS